MTWNRYANKEMMARKYGENKSRTLAGMAGHGRDVEIRGTITPGLRVATIVGDEYAEIVKPKRVGDRYLKYSDDETDIWY